MQSTAAATLAFAIHVVTSSDTDTYSAMAAAVGSLKGAKHGGANIRVADMFEDIKANVKDWKDEEEIRAIWRRSSGKRPTTVPALSTVLAMPCIRFPTRAP